LLCGTIYITYDKQELQPIVWYGVINDEGSVRGRLMDANRKEVRETCLFVDIDTDMTSMITLKFVIFSNYCPYQRVGVSVSMLHIFMIYNIKF